MTIRDPALIDPEVDCTTNTEAKAKAKAKRQPWKAVCPASREPQSQANLFGFKKGEKMIFDGNAGNFFAREGWIVEQESPRR